MSDKSPVPNPFEVIILGSSAAAPTSLRHTTAQVLHHKNQWFLLDCAEGAQIQMRRLKIPLMRINHIFISHLHGDHYLGLPGLLFSMHLHGRKEDLHIYSPPGLKPIIDLQFAASNLQARYETFFHEIESGETIIYEDAGLTVETLEMAHRIPCYGFLIKEKATDRNIKKESIRKYNIPVEQMPAIKRGADFTTPGGEAISNREITRDPAPPRSYAFCSDTAYTEGFLDQIKGSDLLYHEATFLKDRAAVAREKMHSTTVEAATIARLAKAGQLMLGHYSARYKEMNLFLEEAREIFPNTILAEEGQRIPIGNKEARDQVSAEPL